MRGLTRRILQSEYTSSHLRTKLETCGTRIETGRQVWCGSPACDRCRRYRARRIANGLGIWTDGCLTSHRLRRVEATTRPCGSPGELLDEVHRIRRATTRACDYRRRADERWGEMWSYAIWMPAFAAQADGVWTGNLRGIVYLGRVSEIVYADVHSVRLTPFDPCVLNRDVHDHMLRALGSTDGLTDCGDYDLSLICGELDRRGGHRALIARRGLQEVRQ